jgi:hypothetical protein
MTYMYLPYSGLNILTMGYYILNNTPFTNSISDLHLKMKEDFIGELFHLYA